MPSKPSRRDLLRASAGLAAARASFLQALEQDPAPLRQSYDLEQGLTYLNHASIGTLPRTVREAHARYAEVCERNPWYFIWDEGWREDVERTHRALATFVGCDPAELAVTRNTTEAFSLLAAGLELDPKDEVLFPSLNHVGASAAWEHQSEARGFQVRRFAFPTERASELSTEQIVAIYTSALSDATRVLVLPHIDNVVGIRHPVREIANAARARGVRMVAVDGAQTVGMIPVQLSELGVDVYATSGHKWLQAPKGTGLLYVRREAQPALRPMIFTWGQSRWSGTARAYSDYGTRDLPRLLALEDALEFQRRVGGHERERHDRQLFLSAQARCNGRPKLHWASPRHYDGGGALYSVAVEVTSASELARSLFEQERIVVRPFALGERQQLRISPNTMNTEADLDRFFAAVEKRLG